MAVDDIKEFHSENMKENKHHYTLFARATHGHVVNFIQTKGAKIHFNYIYNQDLSELFESNKIDADLSPDELSESVSDS
jgi:hypothetical protein